MKDKLEPLTNRYPSALLKRARAYKLKTGESLQQQSVAAWKKYLAGRRIK